MHMIFVGLLKFLRMTSRGLAAGTRLIGEFFAIYPDYALCRTLTDNIAEDQMQYSDAIQALSLKAQAAAANTEEIARRLATVSVSVKGNPVRIESLSLRDLIRLDDSELKSTLEFYFKNPYAHRRCKRSRWLPAFIRSFPLRVLIGYAKERGLALDYNAFFALLKLL